MTPYRILEDAICLTGISYAELIRDIEQYPGYFLTALRVFESTKNLQLAVATWEVAMAYAERDDNVQDLL